MVKAIKTFSKYFGQIEQMPLILALVVTCIIFSFLTPTFLTVENLMNVLRASSLIILTGIGMTLVILIGEIDLSVGSTAALVGVVGVYVLNMTNNFFLAFLTSLVFGALIGLVNGLIVVQLKVNSLIATLGTMAIVRGLAMVTTNANSIPASQANFSDFGTGYWSIFPKPLVIAVVLFVIFLYVLKNTVFGRYIYAIGGNSSAANLAGIQVKKIKMICFIILGVLAALTGFIVASRLSSGQPNSSNGFELQVVSAVILGGISLTGGKGSLLGAITGILILSVLQNGLTLINVSSFYQDIVRGAVIILAVYIDVRRKDSLLKKLMESKV
jgi:ribose transport system permease protein